jgi:hypothetical protein
VSLLANSLPDDLPPLLRAWIEQLLSDDVMMLVQAFPDAQVDVRLSAARGKVRARPTVVINGGPQTMLEI